MRLNSLPDQALLSRLQRLAHAERRITLSILDALNEVEFRKLHLLHGYSSMFEFCTSRLGYSHSAAARRIRVARCIVRFPEIRTLLAANAVNMSTVAQASRVLDPANAATLLSRIKGRSQRDVEAIVAEYEPAKPSRDRVQSVVVRLPVSPLALSVVPGGNIHCRSGSEYKDSGGGTCDAAADRAHDPAEPARESTRRGDNEVTTPAPLAEETVRRVRLQFETREAFREKFDKVRALAWHRLPANASLADVFELVMDDFIKRNDPIERKRRREARALAKVSRAEGRPSADRARC